MKNSLIILITFFSSFALFGQHKQYERKHELGFGLGAYNYTGELAEYINLKNTKPALNGFYRYNFNDEVSVLRVNLGFGRLGANESNSKEPLRNARAYKFSGYIFETSLVYEFDFFRFRDLDNIYFMSPYLYGGIHHTTFLDDVNSVSQFPGIPFGAGVKFRLNGGWNIGFEAGARKNFTDSLDSRKDEVLTGSSIQTDWHYFAGVNMSYTFYKLVCPKCNTGN